MSLDENDAEWITIPGLLKLLSRDNKLDEAQKEVPRHLTLFGLGYFSNDSSEGGGG